MSLLSSFFLLTNCQELSMAHRTEPRFCYGQPNMELCDTMPATMLPPRPSSLPRYTITFLCLAVHGLHFGLWFKLLPSLDCFPLILTDPVLPILKEPPFLQKTLPYSFNRGTFLLPLHAHNNLFVSPNTLYFLYHFNIFPGSP